MKVLKDIQAVGGFKRRGDTDLDGEGAVFPQHSLHGRTAGAAVEPKDERILGRMRLRFDEPIMQQARPSRCQVPGIRPGEERRGQTERR